ncbi:Hypothetical protein H16_A2579 [Cupriavidus necator H16]|uniref:Uncharacterized protein n=1 Tax=Cupriavidus necator (strain ATCC 17699 / DSM 428 / KCTC 22496 / NCIMB 10442 / H16 / Stanier 337) TaxID=381666 RepID=Q0K8K9_CUPNH|nr:Hypothetical protein H16_A2579 [Cupriavidus necator H16]
MLNAGATGAGGIAAGRGRPRRVKEQIFRTRHGCRCCLTTPGGRTYYFLEFCDRAPVFPVRRQANLPAGTVSRCGQDFSHRSGCRQWHPPLNSVLPEHSVPTSPPASPKPPLGDFLHAGGTVRAAFYCHLPVWRLAERKVAGDGRGWRQPQV